MYEAYSDYESMMNMAEEIVTQCALAVCGKLTIDYQVNELLLSIAKHSNASNCLLWTQIASPPEF